MIMIQKYSLLILFFCALTLVFSSTNDAKANGGLVPNAPSAAPGEGENVKISPILHVTPDQTRVVKLEEDAASIIVSNSDHFNVFIDTPRILVIVPQIPGAGSFTALNSNGDVITQRHVIVAAPKQKYVRIRRACNNSDDPRCNPISIFYCPKGCHQVSVKSPETLQAQTVDDSAANVSSSSSDTNNDQNNGDDDVN